VSKQYLLDQCIYRRVDPINGRIYDISKGPPDNETIAARLVTRENDKESAVTERFNKFDSEIKDIATAFPKKTLYVNGVAPPGEVFGAIEMALYGETSSKELQKRGAVPMGGSTAPVGGGGTAVPLVSDKRIDWNPTSAATAIQANFRGRQERRVPRGDRHWIVSGGTKEGKRGQCERLVERYGVVHISTGDMLRKAVSEGSDLGKKVKMFVEKAMLAPDEMMTELVVARVSEPDCKKNGWVLEGYPKTQAQAEAMARVQGMKPSKFIKLNSKLPEGSDESTSRRFSNWEEELSAIGGIYKHITLSIDGERRPEMIFEDIRRSVEQTPWRIMVNGPPGGGKGTQVESLVSKLGIKWLNTAQLMTKAMSDNTLLGKVAKQKKEEGAELDDETLVQIIVEQLSTEEMLSVGWILDGFPRNEKQVELLSKSMISPDKILLIDVPEEILVPHMTSKRVDPETKKVYFLDDKTVDIPDEVKARLKTLGPRFSEEKIRESMEPYFKTKRSIMSHHPKKCVVVEGEGTQPSPSGNPNGRTSDEVWEGVLNALYSASMKAEKRRSKNIVDVNRKVSANPATGKPWSFFIAGPPGSGKGALAENITAEYGVVHLSTAGIYHMASKQKLPAAERAKSSIEAGVQPIPDDIVIEMIKGLVEAGAGSSHGILLDGFPRNAEQASMLKAAGISPDKFFVIDVDEAEMLAFCTGRLLDPETNTLYHKTKNPPPPEVAARCIQRDDDKESVVQAKLTQHKSDTDGLAAVFADAVVKIASHPGDVTEQGESALLDQVKAALVG